MLFCCCLNCSCLLRYSCLLLVCHKPYSHPFVLLSLVRWCFWSGLFLGIPCASLVGSSAAVGFRGHALGHRNSLWSCPWLFSLRQAKENCHQGHRVPCPGELGGWWGLVGTTSPQHGVGTGWALGSFPS